MELICVARKPIPGTVAANVQEWGTGGINIGACRIGTGHGETTTVQGRWPPNVVLDDDTATQLDRETGTSRFFPVMKYQAKAPQKERPSYTDATGRKIAHPTVKPLTLARWLVRLVTPPDGLCVDPFAGSGTTLEAAILEGFRCIGVEQDETYLPLIMTRIARANDVPAAEGMFEAPVKKGRWPANVAMDRDTAAALDTETGTLSTGGTIHHVKAHKSDSMAGATADRTTYSYADAGGPARFFPVFDTNELPLFGIDEAI
jgi:hypothetical protein